MQVTTSFEDRVDFASHLLADAFEHDPSINYCLRSFGSEQRSKCRQELFDALLTSAISRNASIEEAGGFRSCGVLVPPKDQSLPSSNSKARLVAAGLESCLANIHDISSQTKPCRDLVMKGEDRYFYIFFLGTPTAERGKGLCSAIIRHYQSIAAEQKLPIYLEAGTEYCRSLYESLGFTVVGEIVIGKGKAAADGMVEIGGPGFQVWGMIWVN
ncbi:hypothetical protein ASPZODRAFT_135302, partial [Penicilliopsis zonata CBS 506.65]